MDITNLEIVDLLKPLIYSNNPKFMLIINKYINHHSWVIIRIEIVKINLVLYYPLNLSYLHPNILLRKIPIYIKYKCRQEIKGLFIWKNKEGIVYFMNKEIKKKIRVVNL